MYFFNNWQKVLQKEISKPYFKKMMLFLENEYKTKTIFPKQDDIFKAFNLCDVCDIKLVILGQDPYYKPTMANGLAFSVNDDIPLPKSLINIYKEIKNELNIEIKTGNLDFLAKQGVLLLNTVLTVEENKPNSHINIGWLNFTNSVLSIINEIDRPIVFMLWGNNAKSFKHLLNNKNHLILETSHPSPLGAYKGFFGCNHFIQANKFLNNQIDFNQFPKN